MTLLNAEKCLGLVDAELLRTAMLLVFLYLFASVAKDAYIGSSQNQVEKPAAGPSSGANKKAHKAKQGEAKGVNETKDAVDDGDDDSDEDDEADAALITNKFGLLDGPYKMVLCVNTSLKMEKGKIAAQCGHATLACYRKSLKLCPDAVGWWEHLGQAKIALKIPDDAEMDALQAKARALGLVSYIVEDAGRTQIAAGSRTVLGIGPAPVSVIDSIAAHLKLL